MSRVDNIALANKKNYVDKTRLLTEIHRIDREKCTVMRQLNNEKQRFKSKYSKFDAFSEHRGTEPSDVVMYTTHNPGFCYRRNGECRMPPSPIKNTPLGFEDIHALIFTDGEVDVDKVLCLHLLSTHRTETLTPPPREQRAFMFLAKQQAPLERLIERSKRRWPEDRLTRLLPIYVLDYCRNNPHSKKDHFLRDGRLAARLIVNEKVNVLIRSIMTALEKTNKSMLSELIDKARNTEYLKSMLNKPKVQDFVKNLKGLNVISCCESFCLTLPFRLIPLILDVKTSSGQLETLLKQIRNNIFKLPINCCWEDDYINYSVLSDMDTTSSICLEPHIHGEREISSQNLDVFDSRFKSKINSTKQSQSSSLPASAEEKPQTPTDELLDITNTANASTHNAAGGNTILTRKRSILIARKLQTDTKVPQHILTHLNPRQMKDVDFEKVANLLYRKANIAIKRDLESLEKKKGTGSKTRFQKLSHDPGNQKGESQRQGAGNVYKNKRLLRQVKCTACCEKWREPLPTPKTSHLNKNVVHALDYDTMQDQEMKFWKDYKVLKNDSCPGSPYFKLSARNSFDKNNIIEVIDVSELDLAKVRQEIREHETKKKLDRFLSS
ncbi:hypothetical protein MML48_8g00006298 [Holotrichia oblita]|uniref:Uncharacterized protein n=1 Tax=Holotrichia oblita TaxID=644536 RepID=A0ACB9SQ11_HOLOL|nr:hypothetical protein MML48_8g00006298 [Holotrichia oblita]